MELKKFISKIIVFSSTLFLIVTLFLYFGKMLYNSREYPMWKSKIEYVSTNTKQQNLIIGDSRALAALAPNILDDNFYNLAVGGGSTIEGYYFLKKILKQNKPKKIILSYSPIHLEYSDVFFNRTLKYDALTANEIQEVFAISKQLNEKFYVAPDEDRSYQSNLEYYQAYANAIGTAYKYFMNYRSELAKLVQDPSRLSTNRKVYKEIKERSGNYYFGLAERSGRRNPEAFRKQFKPSKVIEHYLNQLLVLAAENDIKIYYLNIPFNENSLKRMHPDYLNAYDSYFKKLKAKYPKVVWLNKITAYDNGYFGDASHMNPRGVKKFSDYVRTEILK